MLTVANKVMMGHSERDSYLPERDLSPNVQAKLPN